MSTSTTSIIKDNPLRSLLCTTTRPFSAALEPSSYAILIQHSVCFPQRLAAAALSSSNSSHSKRKTRGGRGKLHGEEVDEGHVFRLAGLRTPKETAERDGSGGGLLHSVFMELCERTRGHMVYVKTVDNIALSKRPELASLLESNGSVVDLSFDPCGWDETLEEDTGTPEVGVGHLLIPMNNLEEVVGAIERSSIAVHKISSRSMNISAGDTNAEELTIQPIPIMFDSIDPLIAMHGVDRVITLLQRLGERQEKRFEDGTCFIRTPFIVPVLDEMLSPAYHRRLEDFCDASIILDGGSIQIACNSSRAGSLGGKLIREMQPFQINFGDIGNADGSNAGLTFGQGRNDTVAETNTATERLNFSSNDKQLVARKDGHISKESSKASKGKIVLKHEVDISPYNQTEQQEGGGVRKEGPRIFVEDDDPEFDDFDEEDPDDDLDL